MMKFLIRFIEHVIQNYESEDEQNTNYNYAKEVKDRDIIKLDRVVHKIALNGTIQDIILTSEGFTIIDYKAMSDSIDTDPVYKPNRKFILKTLNYEINDL